MAREPTIKHGEITIEDRRREPLYRITVCGACAEDILRYIYGRAKEDGGNGEELDRD